MGIILISLRIDDLIVLLLLLFRPAAFGMGVTFPFLGTNVDTIIQ